MSNFIASNGVVLDEYGHRTDWRETDAERVHEARKEFYLHLRDKELGQTREGNIIIRPISDDEVLVHDEVMSRSSIWHRHENPEFNVAFGHGEAKRYFAAHPEPKPWHSAIEGDLWEVKYPETAYIAMVSDKKEFVFTDKTSVPVTDENIITARRLWPEGVK